MSVTVKALVVAGGAGGGSGGGGAGGYLYNAALSISPAAYSITVGAGGPVDTNGYNSVFASMTAIGGGRGGDGVGKNGGCGGGGQAPGASYNTYAGGTGSQGYNGGQGGTGYTLYDWAGGGGGAGGAGGGGGFGGGGSGGLGVLNPITGSGYLCGGGGGGNGGSGAGGGSGGSGIGGNGGSPYGDATAGATNTGSGGGGRGYYAAGVGGSGLVQIAYLTGSMYAHGGTVSTVGSYTVHTFTADGTFYVDVAEPSDSIANSASRFVTESTSYVMNLAESIINGASRLAALALQSLYFTDLACSLVVSAYKWLTSTLLSAQQSPAVRPYFQCLIKDDKIVPTAILSNSTYPLNGDIDITPDGYVVAAGLDASGDLSFWKVSDASQLSQWNTPTAVLNSSAGITPLNTSIAVSEYIAGTYRIDIYNMFTNGGVNYVRHNYSNDGGTTWTLNDNVTTPTGLYVNAGKPFQDINGVINSSFFSCTASSIYYYTKVTGSWVGTAWSRTVDSYDWAIQSADSFYRDGIYYVVFSGYHKYLESTNSNYSLYLTRLENYSTNLWSMPIELMSSLSSTVINQNSFTYPKLNYDGTSLWLTFNAKTVNAISTASSDPNNLTKVVSTTTNYYSCKSTDFKNFTYPTALIFTDGTAFTNTLANNFFLQGNYYYIAGNGILWQYTQNNITADVSTDVISCTVQEQGSGNSSIAVHIGNQNGQWVGPTPTSPNYQAIAKDRKILLDLGYYNALGVAETVPRNIFYVDDIQQNITINSNELIVQGRDLYKKLTTTVSRFPYNYQGVSAYNDVMDGTTVSNWNQAVGGWAQQNNAWVTATSYGAIGSGDVDVNYTLLLSKGSIDTSNSIFSVVTTFLPINYTQGYTAIYPFYQDASNWIRLRINNNAARGGSQWDAIIEKSVAGTITNIYSGSVMLTGASTNANPIVIKRSNYYTYTFLAGGSGYANRSDAYHSTNLQYIYRYDFSSDFTSGAFSRGSIAIGGKANNGTGSGFDGKFKYIKYVQFNNSQNIFDIIQNLDRKSGIDSVVDKKAFVDNFYNTTYWNGTFVITNRRLIISAGNTTMKVADDSSADFKIQNGEVEFEAKLAAVLPGNYGFDAIFRSSSSSSTANCYSWNISKATITAADFKISQLAYGTNLMSSSSDVNYSAGSTFNDLKLDLTAWHKYKLVMSDGWMFGFIDDRLVSAWNDNNTTSNFLNAGYIGFRANANTTVYIRNMKSSVFWNQIEQLSVNPGDDMDSALNSVLSIIRGWKFSDMMGRMKCITLSSADTSIYTYQDAITVQQTDNSDKEYVNQVTVYGNGVAAIAQDTQSIAATGATRDMIVSDYKIMTYSDALSRANYELIDAKKNGNQSVPSQMLNVGSEIFDVITVINTGANTSNVSSTLRVYNHDINIGGGNTSTGYNERLETGNL
jgi:hypothetical protein